MCCGYQGDGETNEKVKGWGNSKGINGKGGRNVLYGSLGMDSRDLVAAEYGDALFTRIRYYSASPVGKRSIVTSVSVCLSVCVGSLSASVSPELYCSFQQFLCMLLMWLDPLAALRYIMYFRFYG